MSSKLLDANAGGEPAPWYPGGSVEAVQTPLAPASSDAFESHTDRIRELERELASLAQRIPEERRVAFQQGFEQGAAGELEKWAEAIANAAKTVAKLAIEKPRLRREVESDAVRLALAIAKKVLRRELAVDPAAILGLVRVALEKVSARDVFAIRVAPADVAEVTSRLKGLVLPERVQVTADAALARGSVVLETSQGQIDASVDSQLDEIERGLTDALERRR